MPPKKPITRRTRQRQRQQQAQEQTVVVNVAAEAVRADKPKRRRRRAPKKGTPPQAPQMDAYALARPVAVYTSQAAPQQQGVGDMYRALMSTVEAIQSQKSVRQSFDPVRPAPSPWDTTLDAVRRGAQTIGTTAQTVSDVAGAVGDVAGAVNAVKQVATTGATSPPVGQQQPALTGQATPSPTPVQQDMPFFTPQERATTMATPEDRPRAPLTEGLRPGPSPPVFGPPGGQGLSPPPQRPSPTADTVNDTIRGARTRMPLTGAQMDAIIDENAAMFAGGVGQIKRLKVADKYSMLVEMGMIQDMR